MNESYLDGITSNTVDTPRLKIHFLTNDNESGVPVIFLHGNASASPFWEETMLALPSGYRAIAPDLRGFGNSEPKPVDATRGLREFADDLHSLIETLRISQPVHLVGWSAGGGIIMQYAIDRPDQVTSLTLVNPVSPYGFGGTKDEQGTPCFSDYAGSGGGCVTPEFVERIAQGDRSRESAVSPRNVMNSFYYKPPFRAEREEVLLSAMLSTQTGEANYPGDSVPSENWPLVAPGTKGMLNGLSPKYCNLSGITAISPKPPILWIRGESDQIVSNQSMLELGNLGKFGVIPGWPGEEIYPPQPMVSQTRAVFEQYQANGGQYQELVIAECGHSPHIEQPQAFREALCGFLPNKN